MSEKISRFEALEQQLELFIETTRQVGIIVSDVQPNSQAVLNKKLNEMITGLQEVDKMKSQMADISVPLEVFDYIDQGKNPNLYTKDCLEKTLAKNEQVKGKIDNLKRFKASLLVELTKVFPNEINTYRALRDDQPT
ncbi:mediator of RNA polymerase II transcription subunit 10-like [Mytilus galloprovincialis]|uniref:Mediator of RNA polymerase II transcription subunit 10 n=1 Tax=Mytilus galloprovincialis TaxID=29158 RepID=A0A8B6HFX5_MYTGA|nr:mediator of RNA polymerase II transcription subunit 10 [Mytilus galloprovincialis]